MLLVLVDNYQFCYTVILVTSFLTKSRFSRRTRDSAFILTCRSILCVSLGLTTLTNAIKILRLTNFLEFF